MKRLHLIHVAGLCIAASAASAQVPELVVYTYDSFITEWGPGPAVKAAFEAECGCALTFVGAGDGAALMARLQLEGARSEADIVLGLDTNLTAQAHVTGLFAAHGMTPVLDLPVAWDDPEFLPYDWGFFAFVGNAGAEAPHDFASLAASDLKIAIQDPRSSTPGLGLLMWVQAAYGDEAPAIWEALSDNILTVTPGWSEAYGLFLEGEADLVLSYTTSPAYHILAEEDQSKVALIFDEGHYMQVEVAGILAASDQPELAAQFLAFMVGAQFQAIIPQTNWMYPAVLPEAGLPDAFANPVAPENALLFAADEAAEMRADVIEAWRTALSK